MKLYRIFGKHKSWETAAAGFRSKRFASYEEYVTHQSAKLSKIKTLDKKWDRLKAGLRERLAEIPEVRRGANGLCLGARLGAEVEALIEFGVFAVGIDLNPGTANRYVVTGDFHSVQYADASVDLIYTNSLDHVYDIEKVLAEVKRLLKPAGVFIVDLNHGTKDEQGRDPGYFASASWDHSEEMVEKISASGLTVQRKREMTVPFSGIQVVFGRMPS
jgi:SAM-dependent methyltransferase